MLRRWEALPVEMRTPEVRNYYDLLIRKRGSLFIKRLFDIVVSGMLLALLSPVFLIIAFFKRWDFVSSGTGYGLWKVFSNS